MWDPIKDFFDFIEKDLSRDFEILYSEDRIFNTTREYKIFLQNMYASDDIENWKIDKKFSSMINPARTRILFLHKWNSIFREKTKYPNKLICVEVEKSKKQIRNKYMNLVKEYFYDNIIHIGDNFEHTESMKQYI